MYSRGVPDCRYGSAEDIALDADVPGARSPDATRARDGEASRATILSAARAAFDEKGYAQTSLREIARNAGVKPSLVVHFYGSKAGLLAATVEWPFDPDTVVREVLAMGPDHIGERLADVFLETWEQDGRPNTALTLLHAACERPEAATLMRELFTTCVVAPIVKAITPSGPSFGPLWWPATCWACTWGATCWSSTRSPGRMPTY
ncbi:TetR/AcrR family transcriptional regulator [Streptomyces sp. T1317-0309]|nr:TetR/AcrR family transcriptional regulator [Streptomyces sp. T1317-0309]